MQSTKKNSAEQTEVEIVIEAVVAAQLGLSLLGSVTVYGFVPNCYLFLSRVLSMRGQLNSVDWIDLFLSLQFCKFGTWVLLLQKDWVLYLFWVSCNGFR